MSRHVSAVVENVVEPTSGDKRSTGDEMTEHFDQRLARNTIGMLNGPWALLLKCALVFFPFFMTAMMAWGTWVTTKIFAGEASVAFAVRERDNKIADVKTEMAAIKASAPTREDWQGLLERLRTLEVRLAAFPNQLSFDEWRKRFESLDAKIDKNVDLLKIVESKLDKR